MDTSEYCSKFHKVNPFGSPLILLICASHGLENPELCFHVVRFFFLIFIGVELISNVVLVSPVQQRESVIHVHLSTLFKILFPYTSLQSIE